ncbi:glycosyltransferase [Gammaproteobacteria bacterium]|nr:glycosyltransferase [Gammaproteobacteria bacterium]
MISTYEITLPVLNEEACLERSVRQILTFFNENNLPHWSLAITDNGSTDQTLEIAEQLCSEFPSKIRVISIKTKGVGFAVRESWVSSKADIVGYMDIDLATKLSHLIDVKILFNTNQEIKIINGARRLHNAEIINQKLIRRFTSVSLNIILSIFLNVKFTDAMCGFKFFDRLTVLKLLQETPNIPDWFVCAELLIRAEWQGIKVHEIPVIWTDDQVSRVNVIKLSLQYFKHIKRLFFEKWTKHSL